MAQDTEGKGGFGERIRRVRGERSLTEFAAGFGIHKNTLARYERDEGVPDADFLARLCLTFKVNPTWILTGEGQERMSEPGSEGDATPWGSPVSEASDESLYVYIPLYNVVASGGAGSFLDGEEVVDSLAFKREWVHNELRAHPKDLVLVHMTGESMEPTLGRDDVLLVNRRIGTARADGIYLVRSGEALLVKRLQFLPDGKLRVISDNPAWILTGEGQERLSEPGPEGDATPWGSPVSEASDESLYVYIPLYNVVASGGAGSFLDGEEVVDALAFKREWVHNELRAHPKDLVLVHMTGESMEPTLGREDVLLVNRRIGTARADGIYLVRSGEALLVKRLQFLPDGKLRVISDNSAYEPFTVDHRESDGGFKILGRVVWAGKKF